VHAGFGYFQREAGYTRTGSDDTRVHGRETGTPAMSASMPSPTP
jgi:hypothetical protein